MTRIRNGSGRAEDERLSAPIAIRLPASVLTWVREKGRTHRFGHTGVIRDLVNEAYAADRAGRKHRGGEALVAHVAEIIQGGMDE